MSELDHELPAGSRQVYSSFSGRHLHLSHPSGREEHGHLGELIWLPDAA